MSSASKFYGIILGLFCISLGNDRLDDWLQSSMNVTTYAVLRLTVVVCILTPICVLVLSPWTRKRIVSTKIVSILDTVVWPLVMIDADIIAYIIIYTYHR